MKLAVPDMISNSYFPAIAAIELGCFKQEGIDVELEMIINRAHISGFQALGVPEVKELVSTLLAESGDISFGGSRLMLNAHDTVH